MFIQINVLIENLDLQNIHFKSILLEFIFKSRDRGRVGKIVIFICKAIVFLGCSTAAFNLIPN